MGWGQTLSFVRIRDYADAKRVYESIKPLRGTEDVRPLGQRSSNNPTRISLRADGVYDICLYSTDIISYYPDGDVLLNTGGYDTRTTASAISYMSPASCWIKTVNRHTETQIGFWTKEGAQGGRFVLSGKMVLRLVGDKYVPVDPPIAYVYKERVKKDGAKKARALFKPIENYIKLYLTVYPSVAISRETMDAALVQVQRLTHMYEAGVAPTDEEASLMAWAFSNSAGLHSRYHSFTGSYHNLTSLTSCFWKHVYDKLSLRETYKTELPYGTVAE